MLAALKAGYKHIDCAWVYENEKEVGEALQEAFKAGILKREELFVTSKLWNTFHKKDEVQPMLKESLANLQLEYLDLYLMHFPASWGFEPGEVTVHTPIKETWQAMEECFDAGLTKSIGVSNFSVKRLTSLLEYATKPVTVN